MNAANRVLRPARLRDGRAAYEFLRSNPHWGGVSCGDTSRGIGPALTEAFLDHLTDREGVCVLYTHLGKTPDPAMPIDETAAAGFRRLAEKHRAGRILVTTTRRSCLSRYRTTPAACESICSRRMMFPAAAKR